MPARGGRLFLSLPSRPASAFRADDMNHNMNHKTTRLALPKGRMQSGVLELLTAGGVRVDLGERRYRPVISVPGFGAKLLKPQNVVEMLHAGSRDLGFAGADWVAELNGSLVELLDTGLDPVRVVAAAPTQIAADGIARRRPPHRRVRIRAALLTLDRRSGTRRDARTVVRRDGGVSAGGRRRHRRQHRDGRDARRQRARDRRRTHDFIDPPLRESAGARETRRTASASKTWSWC